MFYYVRVVAVKIILLLPLDFTTCDYHILESEIPNFLYYEFPEIQDKIFPNEIQINMSLTRIVGTLLYTIDINENQLILSLHEDIEEKLKLEFRGEEYYMSLSKLCGCLGCRYQRITLILQINELVNIQCNGHRINKFKYSRNKLINKAYPVLKKKNIYQAKLWLINTPAHDNGYPNNDQLCGCIHEVSHNGQLLLMTPSSSKIQSKCQKTCVGTICNDGICYETFAKEPICNCTNSFMNGKYCNESGLFVNETSIRSVSQIFKFKYIKLTWSSNFREIFYIANKNFILTLTNENSSLYIYYHDINEIFQTKKGIIKSQNKPFTNSTLFVTFSPKLLIYKFINNNKIITGKLYVSRDLAEEYITSMIFLNGTGKIDMVYKNTETEYVWNDIGIRNLESNNTRQKFEMVKSNVKSRLQDIAAKSNAMNSAGQTVFIYNWKKCVIIVTSVVLSLLLILFHGSC